MSSSRGTPSSCAQIRGWTLDWWTDWCCSWTGSTPRYSVTRKPTGSLQIIYDTLTNKQKHPVLTVIMSLHLNLLNWIWTVFRYSGMCSDSIQHVAPCSSGTWACPPRCGWLSCWSTCMGRARRPAMNSTEDFTSTPRTSTPACPPESYKEVKTLRRASQMF